MSMPEFVPKALAKFKHPKPHFPQHAPITALFLDKDVNARKYEVTECGQISNFASPCSSRLMNYFFPFSPASLGQLN